MVLHEPWEPDFGSLGSVFLCHDYCLYIDTFFSSFQHVYDFFPLYLLSPLNHFPKNCACTIMSPLKIHVMFVHREFTVGFLPPFFFLTKKRTSNERNKPPQSLGIIVLHSNHWDSKWKVASPTKTLEEGKGNVGGYLSLQKAYCTELVLSVGWYPAYVFIHPNFKSVGIFEVWRTQNLSQNYL